MSSMAKRTSVGTPGKSVETLTHDEARRRNIPTAEYQSVLPTEQPKQIRYPRSDAAELGEEKSARNRDIDPQLVWRGKDEQDWSDLVVSAPPLYIQEKVHPKVLIDDLLRSTRERQHEGGQITPDLFADFNGIPRGADKTDFYQHDQNDQNWSNRMILGDSLQVMASLAEREGLRGKVQCIYLDPPYGIKFNSNFQWSTTSRDVKDGNAGHITREPEQVKAFRDTWRDGIHSYLTYLRDRLTVARDLLTESGSIFVQIGDENVHQVRAVMDEVFGEDNFCSLLVCRKTSSLNSPVARVNVIPGSADFIIWFAKSKDSVKYRQLYIEKSLAGEGGDHYRVVELLDGTTRTITQDEMLRPAMLPGGAKILQVDNLISQGFSDSLWGWCINRYFPTSHAIRSGISTFAPTNSRQNATFGKMFPTF
jgi:adenine-specific DNA-methyltransferase